MSIYTDSPVVEVNTHGLYVEEALKAVDKATSSIQDIRVPPYIRPAAFRFSG